MHAPTSMDDLRNRSASSQKPIAIRLTAFESLNLMSSILSLIELLADGVDDLAELSREDISRIYLLLDFTGKLNKKLKECCMNASM